MTNYYNSLFAGRDTATGKKGFDSGGESPTKSNAVTRWWLASFMLLMALFIGQSSIAQVPSYTFAQSSGTYTPLATSTSVAAVGWDDTVVTAVPIGFSFFFNGVATAITTCAVSPNGALYFGSTTTNSYVPISATTAYTGVVAGMARDLVSPAAGSSIVRGIEGVAPNRVFVVQWNNAQRYSGGNIAGDVLNFQIRLYETSNIAEVRYGTCTATSTTTGLTAQVGLRGATNTAFNNRSSATSWAATTAGALNSSSVTMLNTILPASGLTLTWSPPPPCSGTPIGGTGAPLASNICPAATVALSVTGSSAASGLTYQWQSSSDNITFANITAATLATYTTPAYVSGTQYYRRNTTCTASALTSPSSSVSVSGPLAPATQASAFTATSVTALSAVLGWTIGSGNNRTVYINSVNSFVDPSNGVSPGTANTVYSGSGQQLVYDATAASVTVTGLTAGTTYYFRVYESTKCVSPAYFFNVSGTSTPFTTADKLKYTITRATGSAYTPVSGAATIVTPTTGTSDDFTSSAVTFFPFQYAGTTISSFKACTNGWMTLNSALTGTAYANALTGSAATNNYTLAPFWEDLLVNNTTTPNSQFLKYEITGVSPSRVLTVQWENVEVYNYAGPSLNFQVKLYETTNVIEYVYGVMQGFDGTNPLNASVVNGLAFNYTMGMNASTWAAPAAAGEAIGLQQANSTSFSSLYGLTANQGLNKLSVMPDCNSMYTFTPSATVRANDAAATIPSAPSNDEPAGAIALTALSSIPANFCGSFYTSAFATASAGVAAPIATTVADDDVWFKFTANSTATTITLRGSGGYDAAMQLFNSADLNTVLASKNVNGLTGVSLTEVINAVDFPTVLGTEYMVRVYHAKGGTTATATATVTAGGIASFTVTNAGTGYTSCNGGVAVTSTPFVYIADATGTGAVGQLVVNATTGVVTGITMLTAGTGYSATPTVTIAPSGFGVTGDFSIIVNATPTPPANDEITTATTLTVGTACVTTAGSTYTASASAQTVCGGNADDDVWYKFVANGTAPQIDVTGLTNFNAHVQVFSSSDDTATGTLTSLYCQNNTTSGLESVTTTGLVLGKTYFVRVYHSGAGAASGNFTICMYRPIPTCATALLPADLATNVARNPTLSWTAPTGTVASSYDVSINGSFVANTLTTSYTTAVLAANTTYTWEVTAKNGNGSASGCPVQTFTTGTLIEYCTPVTSTGCTDGDVIAKVTLNTLDNDSGTGCPSGLAGYSDYTANPLLTTTLQAGTNYSCTVYAGQYSEGYAAWIDYNDNGTFETTERIGFSPTTVAGSGTVGVLGSSVSFPIVVACNPPSGTHRLRVRAMFLTNGPLVTPCGANTYGETEDYNITITPAPACPQPSTGIVLTTPAVTNATASISWTPGCLETEWDVNVQAAGAGVPVATPSNPGLTATTLALTGLAAGANLEFYVRAVCTTGISYSLWSGPYTFATLPNIPGCATLVAPANAGTVSGTIAALSWTAPAVTALNSAAASYDIYHGTATVPTVLLGNTALLAANITGLAYSTTYYWKIVAKNSAGSAIGCSTVYSYTTGVNPFLPYCSAISYTSGVEPITNVTFAGINNTSSAVVSGAANHENFLSVTGNVTTATSYTLTLKGNTNGASFTNNFYVFADWNHDNDFADAGESYPAGTITGSTGVDAIVATSTIAVPEGALPGATRFRVKKLYNTLATDPCTGGGFGQTEDYTLNVTACTPTLWYADTDLDTYGNPLVSLSKCLQPAGYVANSLDCNDANAAINPLAAEIPYDGIDNNCDGAFDEGFPPLSTSLRSALCGTTLPFIYTSVATPYVPATGITGYRFKAKNMTTLAVQTIDRGLFNWFRINQLNAYDFATTYEVSVELQRNGIWLGYYGDVCQITTPATPEVDQCLQTIPAGGKLTCIALTGVTQYTFKVTNVAAATTQTFNRPSNILIVNQIPGYLVGTTYSVSVAVKTANGILSAFSVPCLINPGPANRFGNSVNPSTGLVTEFKAVGAPNPFESNFTLSVTTASDAKVQIAVYDMIGKQLELKEVNATDATEIALGANYPSGVYNVVVSQGANVKSLRMIKR